MVTTVTVVQLPWHEITMLTDGETTWRTLVMAEGMVYDTVPVALGSVTPTAPATLEKKRNGDVVSETLPDGEIVTLPATGEVMVMVLLQVLLMVWASAPETRIAAMSSSAAAAKVDLELEIAIVE